MSCDPQPYLFRDLEDPIKPQGRRNPARKPAKRQRETQVHLPILDKHDAEIQRLEDLAATQRPVTRGECLEEARPCPWVSCPHHVYFERFEEFAAVIESIPDSKTDAGVDAAVASALVELFEPDDDDDEPDIGDDSDARKTKPRRPKTEDAVREAVAGGRAMFTSDRDGRLRSDVLSSTDVRGPWPTCSLDVAEDVARAGSDLAAEDTARTLRVTREAVRLIEGRARPRFASDEGLRPWLEEIVDGAVLDELADSLDWFGGD